VTTALATIKGALRESNLIAIASEPNDNQQTEGLDKLRTLIASVFGYEVGTKLFDFPIGARIGLVDMKGSMATYPITLNAGGRLIEGADSLVVSIDDANYEWMYRADTGNWVRLTLIGIDDELPFPIQYDDYFQTMLAMRLNPRYGRSADAQTVATLQRSLGQLRAAYRQQRSVSAPEDVLRMSNTGRGGIADDVASDRRSHVWMR
jgi:hypothetical protein